MSQRIGIAVVESNDHFLVGVRADNVALPGLAEFPGGKCETDESPRSCVVRECSEETGLLVVPRRQLAVIPWSYAHGDIVLHFWYCALPDDQPPRPDPRPPFRWVRRGALKSLTFPPANAEILRLLAADEP